MLRLSFLGGSTAEATASRLRQALPGTVLSRSCSPTKRFERKEAASTDSAEWRQPPGHEQSPRRVPSRAKLRAGELVAAWTQSEKWRDAENGGRAALALGSPAVDVTQHPLPALGEARRRLVDTRVSTAPQHRIYSQTGPDSQTPSLGQN